MTAVRIDPSVTDLFPDLVVGIVVARGVDNRDDGPPAAAARQMLAEAVAAAADELDLATITERPDVAPWRAAYRAFGVKPNDHRPSYEALLRSAGKGRLGSVGPLVDGYNARSLRHRLPFGGEDLAALRGDLVLTRAAGGEPFVALGRAENDPAKPGEVLYRDDVGPVCRCLNWRETERTMLTPATTDAVLVVEGLGPDAAARVAAAAEDLAAFVRDHLGGTARVLLLDRASPSADLG